MSDQNFEEFESNEERLEARRQKRLQMKRKRQMQQRIILSIFAVVLILIIVLVAKSCGSKSKDKKSNEPPIQPPTEQQPQEPPAKPDVTATIAAVGDIMLYDEQLKDAQVDETTYDFSKCFKAISPYTTNADLTVGNLKVNFLGYAPYSGNPKSTPFFNAPEAFASALADIGFDILQTANTYSIMNGINGLQSTINILNQAKIDHVGTHSTDPAQSTNGGVVLREVNGIKFAFIAFTKGVNGMHLPANNPYSVDLLYTDYDTEFKKIDTTSILNRINAAKALEPDVIIAMLNWGSELDFNPADTQTEIKDLMFKSGVDVILGAHSHVVGPMKMEEVETTDGEKKNCFVAYSLGNFISKMNNQFTQESVILNLQFTKDGDTGDVTISNVNYTPLYILDHGETAETRYEVLPIRNAIQSSMFEQFEAPMTTAIENLKTHTASEYDSGK